MSATNTKKSIQIDGYKIAYVDQGQGDPLVFLHGNPTSSFLWRNIIAPLVHRESREHGEHPVRCIAPDLIGMGDSDKLAESGRDAYTFSQHSAFLDGFLDALDLDQKVTLVVHDWGSALGFDWARRHPDRVRGIAYMEAIVCPMTWDRWSPQGKALFERFRSPEGERLILEENAFLERVLPGGILRKLTTAEHDEYRRPYLAPGESRRPMLSWPRQLPIEGSPANICALTQQYADWLATTTIPKLFINAEPGIVLTGALRETCRRWPNQREVTVRGLHFVQEDSPAEIAEAIGAWVVTLPTSS
ncbi:MAG TPA: haloalkane dehalogenase [Polyangiaceae bacterium]|nr:haloalkane dehalogenase [Polyangiaceae bacterium]